MKTTVKILAETSVVALPVESGVRMDVMVSGLVMARLEMTCDQVGALMFGLEQAADASEQARLLRKAMELATPRAVA